MKKLFVLAAVSLVATSANAAEMKWNGSMGYNYTIDHIESGLNSKNNATDQKDISKRTTKAHWIRANLGATGGWENVEWGAGMRTGGTTITNNDLVNVQNGQDRALGLELAWFRYLKDFGSMNMNLTIGRQTNVLAYDNVQQTLFDVDNRFDGFGWKFNYGMFGLNAAQYVTGASSQGTQGASTYTKTAASEATANQYSKINYLLAFQPHMTWKFSDEIETFLSVGYYKWSDNSQTNAIGSGTTIAGTVPTVGATDTITMHSPRQWHVYNAWTLPYSLKFKGEYVMTNKRKYVFAVPTYTLKDGKEADRTAWSLGLSYGSVGKAQDFMLSYSYGTKGEASVINRYTYDSFAADRKGHMFNGAYSLADNFNLGLEMIFLKEKNTKLPSTGLARTGANAGEATKSSYYNIYAGVSF
jgi:hypothetical protein